MVLCESADVAGPAMVGMGTVLLPEGFIGKVQAGDLEAALAHELAHVRRRDYAKNVGYAVLMLPVSYHPCAWLIKKAVGRKSRSSVRRDGGRGAGKQTYVCAVTVATGDGDSGRMRGGATAAVGIFEGNTLERRVSLMMERGKRLQGAARVAAMVAVMVLSGAAIVSMVGTHVTVQSGGCNSRGEGTVQVPAGVMASRIVSQTQPKYPPEAKEKRIQGTVVLNVEDRERWKCRRPESRVGAERASAIGADCGATVDVQAISRGWRCCRGRLDDQREVLAKGVEISSLKRLRLRQAILRRKVSGLALAFFAWGRHKRWVNGGVEREGGLVRGVQAIS